MAFLDLERAYDCVDGEGLWKVLQMYEVRVKLLNSIKFLCE